MRMYFASSMGKKHMDEIVPRDQILETFLQTSTINSGLKKDPNISIFLDSGAFGAWTRGVKIDIDEYIEYYKRWKDRIHVLANLDVIPGKAGGGRETFNSPALIEFAAEQGWKNYQYMLSKGVEKEKLIHIFHQGEETKWLEKLVKEGGGYVGLSPANDVTTRDKILWLDRCMNYVADSEGVPLVKFHGFAVTSIKMMRRYPWYSVDSGSWNMGARYGPLFIPSGNLEKYDYSEPRLVMFLPISLDMKTKPNDTKYYSLLGIEEKRRIDEYVEYMGYDVEALLKDGRERDKINGEYFLKLQEVVKIKKKKRVQVKPFGEFS